MQISANISIVSPDLLITNNPVVVKSTFFNNTSNVCGSQLSTKINLFSFIELDSARPPKLEPPVPIINIFLNCLK